MLVVRRLLSLLCVLITYQAGIADDRATLANVLAGWEHNRMKIGDVFLCEFKIETFDNTNEEAPVLLYTRSGVWARLGDLERYSLECDVEPQIASVTSRQRSGNGCIIVAPCGGEKYLHSKDAQLRFSDVMSVANVHREVDPTRGITTTPLSMGVMGGNEYRSLPQLIRRSGGNDGKRTNITVTHVPGNDRMISIRTHRREESPSGTPWDNIMQWCIDPDSGYLPVVVTVYDGPNTWASKTTVSDVVQLKNGGYWPNSFQTVTNPDSSLPRLHKVSTTRLSFARSEVEIATALSVPTEARVVNPDNMRSWFTLGRHEIRADELTELLDRAAAVLRERDAVR